jgi:hypothetical protein
MFLLTTQQNRKRIKKTHLNAPCDGNANPKSVPQIQHQEEDGFPYGRSEEEDAVSLFICGIKKNNNKSFIKDIPWTIQDDETHSQGKEMRKETLFAFHGKSA